MFYLDSDGLSSEVYIGIGIAGVILIIVIMVLIIVGICLIYRKPWNGERGEFITYKNKAFRPFLCVATLNRNKRGRLISSLKLQCELHTLNNLSFFRFNRAYCLSKQGPSVSDELNYYFLLLIIVQRQVKHYIKNLIL